MIQVYIPARPKRKPTGVGIERTCSRREALRHHARTHTPRARAQTARARKVLWRQRHEAVERDECIVVIVHLPQAGGNVVRRGAVKAGTGAVERAGHGRWLRAI